MWTCLHSYFRCHVIFDSLDRSQYNGRVTRRDHGDILGKVPIHGKVLGVQCLKASVLNHLVAAETVDAIANERWLSSWRRS